MGIFEASSLQWVLITIRRNWPSGTECLLLLVALEKKAKGTPKGGLCDTQIRLALLARHSSDDLHPLGMLMALDPAQSTVNMPPLCTLPCRSYRGLRLVSIFVVTLE
jgi:hypothetical protein